MNSQQLKEDANIFRDEQVENRAKNPPESAKFGFHILSQRIDLHQGETISSSIFDAQHIAKIQFIYYSVASVRSWLTVVFLYDRKSVRI